MSTQQVMSRKVLTEKWAPVLDHPDLPPIKDPHRREVTAFLLENQKQESQKAQKILQEDVPNNISGSFPDTGGVAKFDPVLISLVRRAMPKLIAFDVCGVQPMAQPTGLVFAMKSRYTTQGGAEALFNEADTEFAGAGDTRTGDVDPTTAGVQNLAAAPQAPFNFADPGAAAGSRIGRGFTTAAGETVGGGGANPNFNEMAFSIERVIVQAQTRKLKAEYSLELAQDMRSIHGLDAEAELSNILSAEILAEINREVIRTIYQTARPGAVAGSVATAGTFDLDVDANGRWSVEKFKGLLFQVEREANAIGHLTRRGRGNFIICSADVASALQMAGVLDYAPALRTDITVDDTQTTFAGILNGKYRVYVDPYTANVSANPQFFVAGYKGPSYADAGLFYCPYVPLQMMRAVDPNNMQPKIAFQTRYGLVANPFSTGVATVSGELTPNTNVYFRRVRVTNLL